MKSKLVLFFAFACSALLGWGDITWKPYNTIVGVDGKPIPAGTPLYFFATSKTQTSDARTDLYAVFTGDGLNFDDLPNGYEFHGETTMTKDGTFDSVTFPSSKNGWTRYGYVLVSSGTKSGETGTFIYINMFSSGTSFNVSAVNTTCWSGTMCSGAGSIVTGPTLKAKATAFLGAYDGTAKKIGVTVTKKPGDEEASVAYSYNENGPFVAEGSFDWPTDVSAVTVFAQVSYPSWDPVKVSAQLTITQRVATVTAGSAQKEFDATPLTCGTFDAVGFIDGEGIESLAMTAASTITKPGAAENVIDEATVEFKDGTKSGNYAITYVKGALTIDKRATGLEVTAIPYEAVYDGEYHVFDLVYTFTGPKTDAEPTILYSTAENGTYYETNNISSLGANYKNCQTSAQTLWAKVSYPGYEDIKVSSTVTILKRPVTVTADSQTWAYNGSSHNCTTFTVSPDPATDDAGFVGSEGIKSVSMVYGCSIVNPGTVANKINSINYKSGTLANNYTITKVDGLLTVTAIGGLEATAKSCTNFYNASAQKITVTRTAPSDYNTPTITYSYDEEGPFVADASFVWPKNVTNVTVYAKVEQTGYVPKIVSADIVIKPRTVVLKAGDKSQAYNGLPLTYTSFSVKTYTQAGYPSGEYGFTSGQGVTTLSMTAESTITDPGTQPNVIDESTIKGNSSTILSNYIILTEPGTLTVTENTGLSISLTAMSDCYYDGKEHMFTASANQSKATLFCSLTGADDDWVPMSEFAKFVKATDAKVTVYLKAELHGYKTATKQTTVWIKKRTVTVTAASETWVIDGEWHTNNCFTVSPANPDNYGNGFAAGEGIDSLSMTTESKIKELGTQPNVIDQSSLKLIGATDLANYNVTWKNGTLTVRNPPYITWKVNPNRDPMYGKDGNKYNGKIYLIYSVDEAYQASVVTAIADAFKSDAGLDLQKLGEIKPGACLLAEAEAVDGKFTEQTVLMIPEITSADGRMHALRTLAISKGTDGKDYIFIDSASQVSENGTVSATIQSTSDWQGPGHLASGAAEPTSDKGTVTKGEDGNYTVTDIPEGTTEVKITIPEGVPATATFTVPVDELASVSGVPTDRLVVTVNGIVVDQKYFKGAQDGGSFNAELGDAAAPELVEETDELKPLVVDEDIALTVTVIPGLTYQLLRATELGGEKPSFAACGEPQTAAAEATTLKLIDVDKPADKAFYKVSVSK